MTPTPFEEEAMERDANAVEEGGARALPIAQKESQGDEVPNGIREDEGLYNLASILYPTTDAAVWAREFIKVVEGGAVVDEGLMIGWFANAMETAKTHVGDRYDEGYADGQRDTSHALMGIDR